LQQTRLEPDPATIPPLRAERQIRAASQDLERFRRILLYLLLIGMTGVTLELYLLEHGETLWQFVPFAVLGPGLVLVAWVLLRPGRAALWSLRAVMALCTLAAPAGLFLHYEGNAEFELEMYPTMKGKELFWNSITGATPALAPGTMALLGLLGLACTYRHPLLRSPAGRQDAIQEKQQ
jgi:hypothetical protein